MNFSRLLSLSTAVAGGASALRVLARRHAWEQSHNRVAICIDFDDAQAVAIRAGLPFTELLHLLAHSGASHVSLPELTLNRLQGLGQLVPQAPATWLITPPAVGHWNYLRGAPQLVAYLAEELAQRLPYTQACCLDNYTLVFAGNLPTLGEIGLGFDSVAAAQIRQQGLGIVPRPVSYDWPERRLIERTLSQAATFGSLIAFAGNMLLGHEMHLDETLAALSAEGLSFVFFVESRHQRGDWHTAKRHAPHIALGHRFTPEEMLPLDRHAAAHNWAYLARERGIRFCYVNFFRVLHATKPLEGLDYVHHLKHALEDNGFVVAQDLAVPTPIPTPNSTDLALAGLASAGAGAAAVAGLLGLPEAVAVPLTLVAAGGAATLPFIEQRAGSQSLGHSHSHDHHDHDHDHDHDDHGHGDHDHKHDNLRELYPPSYAPKLLGLAAATLAPIAALQAVREDGAGGWLSGLIYQSAAALSLAAVTSGQDYHLRVEEYKGFNLDWLLPLLAAANTLPNRTMRLGTQLALAGAWLALRQRQPDVLAQFDLGHAEGHTHHVSAATRLIGDSMMALGPRPARKWAGLSGVGYALSLVLARRGYPGLAAATAVVGTVGQMLGLVGFRRSERALSITLQETLPSMATGTALGLIVLLMTGKQLESVEV